MRSTKWRSGENGKIDKDSVRFELISAFNRLVENPLFMAARNLIERTYHFAVAVGELVIMLPNTVVNRAYGGQLVRSSSSVYANYRASQRAKSSADFLNKLKIVEEECDESVGFLELLLAFNPDHKKQIDDLIKEGDELLKIFVASIKTTRNNINLKKKLK